MSEIVAVDIGGTHARFAIAEIGNGRIVSLAEPCILRTQEHAGLEAAWEEFRTRLGRPLPGDAGIAIAGPVQGETLKLTNCPWTIRPAAIGQELGLERHIVVNDFVAVGHAVAQLDEPWFRHVCGPERPLPVDGVISIVGPGTGLGVAMLVRRDGHYQVIETEGGHIDFAPLDSVEDSILAHLRARYGRVSVERIVSGPGLFNIHEALAAARHRDVERRGDAELWAAALAGGDSLAAAALDRFLLSLGAVAGDIALAQGAAAIVIAGGLGLRIADHLPRSGFAARLTAKGRFQRRMADMPVKRITHRQAGLFGAAAAFVRTFEG